MKKFYLSVICILTILTIVNVSVALKPQKNNDSEKITIINKTYSYNEVFKENKK